MKKFFKFAAVAAIVAMIASCGKEPGPEPGPGTDPTPETPTYTEDLTFTLEVTEVEADQAKIKVKHNGTTKDTWYGFATTETDVNKAIEDVLAEGKVTLKKNTSTTMTVRDLQPETKYTFVAVGVKADGTVYGTHASVEFTTAKAEEPTPPTPPAPEGYTVNPNWTVTYIGDYEEGGKVYDNVVVVETTDTNPYFVTAWPVDYYEELGIEAIVDAEIETWNEMLAQYPGATWADIVYAESILSQVSIDPEYGTKWYAMAIGCDTNGKATGLYALSEVIDLENLGGNEDVELTPEYAAWLGNWTFTGSNGVSFDVTMKQGKANQTYKLAGWEGPEAEGLDITVEWMADYGIWAIYAQSFGTFEFEGAGKGEIWLTPESKDGYIYPAEGVPACMGGMTEDGQMVVEGYSEELEDGSVVEMATMMYLVKLQADGKYYGITNTNEWPTFPLTVTPATKATTNAVKEFKGGKKTLNPFAAKTFKTFGLCDMSVRTF